MGPNNFIWTDSGLDEFVVSQIRTVLRCTNREFYTYCHAYIIQTDHAIITTHRITGSYPFIISTSRNIIQYDMFVRGH